MADLILQGVLPAPVTPFDRKGEVDESALRKHFRDLLAVEGITGLVPNADAGEGKSLTPEERKHIIRICVEEVQGKVPVIACINADSAPKAVESALDAKATGASAILLAPPSQWLIGWPPEAPHAFVRAVAQGAGIPIVIFQYALWMGKASYDPETLARLVTIDGVVGVKDTAWEVKRYEEEYRAVKAAAPHVAMLSACDEHLLHTYLVGADGTLVVYAALVPELIVELFETCQRGELQQARSIHDRLWPVSQAVFSTFPQSNWVVRIKECLVLMGRLESATVRSPLIPASEDERKMLQKALQAAALV